jgi:hypothetical protein
VKELFRTYLELLLGERNIASITGDVFYGIPFKKTDTVLGTLPLIVANVGEKNATNVLLQVVYLLSGMGLDAKFNEYLTSGDRYRQGTDRHTYSEKDGRLFVSYRFSKLHPKTAAKINEPFFIQVTSIDDTMKARFAHGKDVNLDIHVDFSYIISVTMLADDFAPEKYNIHCHGVHAETLDHLIAYRNKLQDSEAANTRKKIGVLKYSLGTLFSKEAIDMLVMPQKSTRSEIEGSTMHYFQTEPSDITFATRRGWVASIF